MTELHLLGNTTPTGVGVTLTVTSTADKAFCDVVSGRYLPGWEPYTGIGEGVLLNAGHPCWRTAEARFYVARYCDREARAALVVDHQHNERWRVNDGYLAFFESDNDEMVASAILNAVREAAIEARLTRLLATANPSANYSIGVQVDGFDAPPVLLLNGNPPYYPTLLEANGFSASLEWLAVRVNADRAMAAVHRLFPDGDPAGVDVRLLTRSELWARRSELRTVYNSSFGGEWGFNPMLDEEFDDLVARLGRARFRGV